MAQDDIVSALVVAREALFTSITGLTEEQFRRRPGNGNWSIVEILAHVAAARRRAYAQVCRLLSDPGCVLPVLTDEERQREAGLGRRLPPPQIIHDLIGSYRRITELLAELREDDIHRSGFDSDGRPVSIQVILSELAAHEIEHAAQICALKAAFTGW